jgi:hypothetical protein
MQVAENSKKNITHCARSQDSPSGVRCKDSRVPANFFYGNEAPSSETVNKVRITFDGNPCEKMSRKVTTLNPEIQPVADKHCKDRQPDWIPLPVQNNPEEVGITRGVETFLVSTETARSKKKLAEGLLILLSVVKNGFIGDLVNRIGKRRA